VFYIVFTDSGHYRWKESIMRNNYPVKGYITAETKEEAEDLAELIRALRNRFIGEYRWIRIAKNKPRYAPHYEGLEKKLKEIRRILRGERVCK